MPKSIHRDEHLLVRQLLREVRKRAGLSQVELAVRLGRQQTYVSTSERGLVRQDFLQLRDWCAECGTTLAALAQEFEDRLKASQRKARKRSSKAA